MAMELLLPVLRTWVFPDRGSNPDLPHLRQTLYHYATTAVNINLYQYIGSKNYYLPLKKRIGVSYVKKKIEYQSFNSGH